MMWMVFLLLLASKASALGGTVQTESQNITFYNSTSNLSSAYIEFYPASANVFNLSVCSQKNEFIVSLHWIGAISTTISPSIFSLNNSCQLVNFTTIIESNRLTGNYSNKILVLTTSSILEFPITMYVLESSVWNVTPRYINYTIAKGRMGFNIINFTNNGNSDLSMSISLLNNGENIMWIDDSPVSLKPFQSVLRPLYYNSRNLRAGYRNITLRTSWLSSVKDISINFTIRDMEAPVVGKIYFFPSDKVTSGQSVIIEVDIYDDNIKTVWGFIGGVQYNFTMFNSTRYKSAYTNTSKASTYLISVFAKDGDENTGSNSASFTVVPYSIVSVYNSIDLGKIKYFSDVSKTMLKLNGTASISLTLLEFYSAKKVNYTVLAKGKEMKIGERIDFGAQNGEIPLVIRQKKPSVNGTFNVTDYLTQINGKIRVESQEDINISDDTIYFFGTFDDYTVPQPRQIQVPFMTEKGNFMANETCIPQDNGALENSFIRCMLDYPMDVDLSSISLVMSADSFEQTKETYRQQIEFITREKENEMFWKNNFGISIVAIILLFLTSKFVLENLHYH